MRRRPRNLTAAVVCAAVLTAACSVCEAQRAAKGRRPAKSPDELVAKRLLEKAKELLAIRETDRAVGMLETIIQQHPNSSCRLDAYLALGKHFLSAHQQARAINYLAHLKALKKPDEQLTAHQKGLYLEALYLTGVAHFQMKQYGSAFPILRKITGGYPNTVWANQAYYYIGMCHFAQGNWNKAIKALGLVGTFVDPDSPTVEYAEAGRRFYVKVEDGDLQVLHRLGGKVSVVIETAKGDRVTLPCIPLSEKQGVFITSVATEVGRADPKDQVLQIVGGDSITVKYVDDNTKEGKKNVLKTKTVKVVSTASLGFFLGDFETKAPAAFQGQPLFVKLNDVDHDTGPKADTVAVKIVARYRDTEETEPELIRTLGGRAAHGEEERYATRDEVTLTLTELGEAPVHSGRFGGSVQVATYREDQAVDKTDGILSCAVNDEIVATLVDTLHIAGRSPRQAEAAVRVAGEIDSRPHATQKVVVDVILRARKNLVEATAYRELARIFKSMGLAEGAKRKAAEGLDRVEPTIRLASRIPSALREEAFKLKWELHLAADDFRSAIATCRLFNRLYPDSPFADQALMGIGRIKFENELYREAIGIFRQVLRLPRSQARAEAQFMIARAIEAGGPKSEEAAVREYKLCAERYPDTDFAGQSLAKLVDYHIKTKDYSRANDLLSHIFEDYEDAKFLDNMLLKWVTVAYKMGDYQKAHDKCAQLIFEYPAGDGAKQARKLLPAIKDKLKPKP